MPLPELVQPKGPVAVSGKLIDMQMEKPSTTKSKYLRAPPREKKKKEKRNIEEFE
jgi:hypothetical protein